MKIFHDSIERILYINVLNISIDNNNYHEPTTINTINTTTTPTTSATDSLFNSYNVNNNNNSNNYKNNEVESIYCLLHLLLKKRK